MGVDCRRDREDNADGSVCGRLAGESTKGRLRLLGVRNQKRGHDTATALGSKGSPNAGTRYPMNGVVNCPT